MSNPTIVFAPGAWHTADCYDGVRKELHAKGWETEAVDYPSVGAEPPSKGLSDDVAAVRAAVEKLVDEGKKVMVVVHSYGGLVGAEAVKGLGLKQRAQEGQTGGVIQLVYLSAFVMPKGKSILEVLGGQYLPWMRVEGDYVYTDTPDNIFYHDVEADAQAKAIAALKHQSRRVYVDKVEYEPWHDIPCFFLFCDEDRAVPLGIQQNLASMLGPDSGSFHVKSSHSPFLSMPTELIEGLEQAAKDGLAKSSS
ncbi:signal peptide protein [Fusarium mundagurra]|uniref:Signal peptide protein n=1 Tax=Fusarium mundagurra TaxID=1567541 RepID=A0A8H6CXR6_9HYPO|nr:signal peptide protein [Fusarium mundagurra]